MATVFGDTPGDLSRNALALRIADDMRAQAIANSLQANADLASRERMANRDIDSTNWRWATPNATARSELASRERLWATPNATQEGINRNQLAISRMPWDLGITPAQKAQLDAESQLRRDQIEQNNKFFNELSAKDKAYLDSLKNNPMGMMGNNSLASGLFRNNVLRSQDAADASVIANNRLASRMEAAIPEVQSALDKGVYNKTDWLFTGMLGSNAAKGAGAIVYGDDATTDEQFKDSNAYKSTKLWWKTRRVPGLANEVLNEMGDAGAYIQFDPTTRKFVPRGSTVNPQLFGGAAPSTGSNTNAFSIGNYRVTQLQ